MTTFISSKAKKIIVGKVIYRADVKLSFKRNERERERVC